MALIKLRFLMSALDRMLRDINKYELASTDPEQLI